MGDYETVPKDIIYDMLLLDEYSSIFLTGMRTYFDFTFAELNVIS